MGAPLSAESGSTPARHLSLKPCLWLSMSHFGLVSYMSHMMHAAGAAVCKPIFKSDNIVAATMIY